jgi:hypothetical protein
MSRKSPLTDDAELKKYLEGENDISSVFDV